MPVISLFIIAAHGHHDGMYIALLLSNTYVPMNLIIVPRLGVRE